MALSNRVDIATKDGYVPMVADAITTGYAVLPMRLFANPKKFTGARVVQPWQVVAPAQGGNYSGSEEFSVADEDLEIKGLFEHRNIYHTIAITGDDLDRNNTEGQVIDLLKLKMEQLQQALGDKIATDFWSDGTANGNKQVLGIVAAISQASDVANYGGQSRSAYSALDCQQTASGGTLTFDNMRTVYRNCVEGPNMPTLILTTPTVWDLFESLVLPTQSLNVSNVAPSQVTAFGRTARQSMMQGGTGLHGISGFTALTWKGVPIVGDEKATSQTMYFINEDTMKWYGMPKRLIGNDGFRSTGINVPTTLSGTQLKTKLKDVGMSATDWVRPVKQDAYFLTMILKGSVISSNPRYNGKLTDITTA